jgi:hypothetical protein
MPWAIRDTAYSEAFSILRLHCIRKSAARSDKKKTMTSNSNELGDQMEAILDLMTKRSKGEASNQQVEAAASQIISVMGGSKPPSKEEEGTSSKGFLKKRSISGPSDSSAFQADTGNYDDDEEDDNKNIQQKQPMRGIKRKTSKMPAEDPEGEEDESYQDQIDQIKLGKQGAKMMTTFGDGPRPDPEALTAALLGARKCLQVALFDARALRRHEKQTYQTARQSFAKRKTKAPASDAVDPNMLYRAFSGYDKLSYDPKCGFDMEQLRHLFPEEMRAYMRWKDLHAAYQESSADEKNNAIQVENGKEDNEEKISGPEEQDDTAVMGGHLQQRAAQFDHRTDIMKSDWYIKFAQVRQGSFLPRGIRHRKNEAESEWDKSRKSNRKRGAPVAGIWETMSATQVQFLHWLGFQPPAMPPPNEETTQALGFLGYDFLGKIVEKVRIIKYFDSRANVPYL